MTICNVVSPVTVVYSELAATVPTVATAAVPPLPPFMLNIGAVAEVSPAPPFPPLAFGLGSGVPVASPPEPAVADPVFPVPPAPPALVAMVLVPDELLITLRVAAAPAEPSA